jgi:NADPH:quinone reductase-like Zn-dependent oxidoreductase
MSVTFTAIGRADFGGRIGAGSVSVPGLKAGDQVFFYCQNPGGWQQPGGLFEAKISVNDEIQQLVSSDLSAQTFTVLFFRSV